MQIGAWSTPMNQTFGLALAAFVVSRAQVEARRDDDVEALADEVLDQARVLGRRLWHRERDIARYPDGRGAGLRALVRVFVEVLVVDGADVGDDPDLPRAGRRRRGGRCCSTRRRAGCRLGAELGAADARPATRLRPELLHAPTTRAADASSVSDRVRFLTSKFLLEARLAAGAPLPGPRHARRMPRTFGGLYVVETTEREQDGPRVGQDVAGTPISRGCTDRVSLWSQSSRARRVPRSTLPTVSDSPGRPRR